MDQLRELRQRLITGAVAILALIGIGTVGYRLLAPQHDWLDALYMTVISLTTVGFGEITGDSPPVRIFTIFLLLFGVAIFTYFVTSAAVLVFEAQLHHAFWRRRMEKQVARLDGHHIVCGSGVAARHAVAELRTTGRNVVLVVESAEQIESLRDAFPGVPVVIGDATSDMVLGGAGVGRAAGIIACTDDDRDNLIITMIARRSNPGIRIVARADTDGMEEKMRNVGANAVVSPSHIGGLRLASELVRPTTVSFLDQMLRDRQGNLRVDEVPVPAGAVGVTIGELDLGSQGGALLVAARMGDRWLFNPPSDTVVAEGTVLIFMGRPEELGAVGARLSARAATVRPGVPAL